jgi:hypothetical protein
MYLTYLGIAFKPQPLPTVMLCVCFSAAALNIQVCIFGTEQAAGEPTIYPHTYWVVQEDADLSPALLLALIRNQKIVTSAWAEAAATGRKAWPEELFLNTVVQHRPARLRVPPKKAAQGFEVEGQESSWLVLSEWKEKSAGLLCDFGYEIHPGLLSEYLLVFEQQVGFLRAWVGLGAMLGVSRGAFGCMVGFWGCEVGCDTQCCTV